jgi:hypothetical protein
MNANKKSDVWRLKKKITANFTKNTGRISLCLKTYFISICFVAHPCPDQKSAALWYGGRFKTKSRQIAAI